MPGDSSRQLASYSCRLLRAAPSGFVSCARALPPCRPLACSPARGRYVRCLLAVAHPASCWLLAVVQAQAGLGMTSLPAVQYNLIVHVSHLLRAGAGSVIQCAPGGTCTQLAPRQQPVAAHPHPSADRSLAPPGCHHLAAGPRGFCRLLPEDPGPGRPGVPPQLLVGAATGPYGADRAGQGGTGGQLSALPSLHLALHLNGRCWPP